jgi:hypothetical protein
MIPFIPFPYKVIALLLIVASVFFYGYKKGSDQAEVEIAKYESKLNDLAIKLEREQANVKEKIVTEFVDKIQVVKEKEYVFLNQASNNVPSQYNLSNGWVYLHDQAATSGIPEATRSSDATASDVRDNQALATVVANYSRCLQNAQQLISLQDWVIKTDNSINTTKPQQEPLERKGK